MKASCTTSWASPLTVNCLLAQPKSSFTDPLLWAGCYQHLGNQQHTGTVTIPQWSTSSQTSTPQQQASESPSALFPGVFDMHLVESPEEQSAVSLASSTKPEGDTESDTSTSLLLRCSCTDGSIRWLRCNNDTNEPMEVHSVVVCNEGTMLTSSASCGGRLACTLHGGSLALLGRDTTGAWAVEHKWEGHEFDAWCVAPVDPTSNSGVGWYTGGDDGLLRLWDAREANSPRSAMQRRFDAGVVTIQHSTMSGSNVLLVGSYDESLTVLDLRSWKQRLGSVAVGGGVWRIRPMGHSSGLCAVAAMQRGAAVVQINNGEDATVLGYLHEEDENSADVLIYDVAVCGEEAEGSGVWRLATASFYNRIVKQWEVTLEK